MYLLLSYICISINFLKQIIIKPESFFSFMAGALIGVAAAALYLSSDKGTQAREKIKDSMHEGFDAAQTGYAKAKQKVKECADEFEDKVSSEAKNIKRKAKAAKQAYDAYKE